MEFAKISSVVRPRLVVPVALGAALAVITWTCSDNDETSSSARVDIGLAEYIGPTVRSGAVARKIESKSDLIGGEAAQGRIGDYLLQNESIRVIIQQPDRTIGPGPFGGTIIDGDVVRPDGTGHDVIGEITPFINLGRTMEARTVEVVRDGSGGGAAIVAATGPDEILDYLNIQSVVSQYLGTSLKLALNPDQDLPLTITNYFILRPGDRSVRYVTAIRNDGPDKLILLAGDLIDSGGNVEFFNPGSSLKGFGYGTALPEAMDFLAFRGTRSSYAYAPPPINGKPGAAYMVVSGVAGTVMGLSDAFKVIEVLTSPSLSETTPGATPVAAGGVAKVERWVAVGTGALSSITDALYEIRQVATGKVEGRIVDTAGNPLAGARVSAIKSGATLTQFLSDETGTFSGTLPEGSYALSGQIPGRIITAPGVTSVSAGGSASATVTASLPSYVDITAASPSGVPLPAKVSFICEGDCPESRTSQLRDISFDKLPDKLFQQDFVGATGKAHLPIAPGAYRIVASRGTTYSLWPTDTPTSGGYLVQIAPGETKPVSVTLARVVDVSGHLSSDFHVHSINSPDSPVPESERVLTFLGEGVDVLVSSDHDYITDFAPTIKTLGAESYIRSIIGNELTTFDYGHFNGFPTEVKTDSINGGAFDWAGGTGPSIHPADIFASFDAHPGEQVVQVNHPNWGYFTYIALDVTSGATLAKPSTFRIADPAGMTDSDTKLFSEKFTAVELYNGFALKDFYVCLNYWLGFLNRGFVVTGTAVSDTHRWRTTQSGFPRSFVRVGTGQDAVSTFNEAAFVTAVNQHKLIGTNGPFVRLSATNTKGSKAETGETITASAGETVTVTAEVQTPSWFKIDRVELYSNVRDTIPSPGKTSDAAPKPLQAQDVAVDPTVHLLAGAEGGTDYGRYLVTVHFTDVPKTDSYYLVMVRGKDSLFPVITDASVTPFAFTNPVFVDVGGDGFKPLVERRAPPRWSAELRSRIYGAPRPATPQDFYKVLEAARSHH